MEETLRRMREKRASSDSGFTLIELLVVVVIIGVLVVIAIPVYLNYREGAADKSAQSDVRGAIAAIEEFYTSQGNTYPSDVPAQTGGTVNMMNGSTASGKLISLSDGTEFKYTKAADGKSYTICAANTGGAKTYRYRNTEGGSVKEFTGAGGFGGCS